MKLKKLTYSLLLILTMGIAYGNESDGDTKVTKTVSEAFLIGKGGSVEIINKYGQVVINNSNSDSVTVNVEIIAYGKDRETANKILDRVDFDFTETNQYLTLETVLDRKSGAFKELWNNIGDYSKTLLSKNKLIINYEVNVPNTLALSINNKFGDLYIPDRDKKVNIEMSHGNLRANRFEANSDISVSYGNTEIEHLSQGSLKLKISEAEIKSLGNVEIQSSSSEIYIKEASDLEVTSRSDKKIEITKAKRVSGQMSFSKLRISELTKSLDAQMSYSDVEVELIPFSFSMIDLDGKSSDIDLTFDGRVHMDVDLEGEEDKIDHNFSELTKTFIDEKKGIVQYRGETGANPNYKGNLNIKAQRGSINIRSQALQSVKSK